MGTTDAAAGSPRRRAAARAAGVAGAALAAALAVLGPAAPADAHASPVAASPAQGSVIGSSPTEVTVTFSEPVAALAERVQVLAPDGERINGIPTVRGTTLHIPVRRADQPLGTYLVSYRVISADSHPVGGGFTFSVGAPSATVPRPPADEVHRSVVMAIPVATGLGYAGLVLATGPALLLALLWPRRLARRGPVRLVYSGLGLILVGTLATVWLQVPYRSGAAVFDGSGAELWQVVDGRYGVTMALRVAVLAALAVLLPPALRGRARRARGTILLLLATAGLASWPLSGHAAASPVPAASIVTGVVHLAAMSVWVGGLLTLLVFLLPRAHPRTLGVLLPAWSRWATIAVVWLVGAGAVQALIGIGTVGGLVGTGYGRLVLAKVALLALVLGAAALARRLVHQQTVADTGPGLVRRLVAVEVAATAVIVALSAVLVQVTPGRSTGAPSAATPVDGVSQTLTSDLFTLQFNIYPVQLGETNTVHAFVYTPQGKPMSAEEWKVTTVLPARGIEPVSRPLLSVLPHHALGAVAFPVPGQWEVRFTVRTSEIDQATVRTTITVR